MLKNFNATLQHIMIAKVWVGPFFILACNDCTKQNWNRNDWFSLVWRTLNQRNLSIKYQVRFYSEVVFTSWAGNPSDLRNSECVSAWMTLAVYSTVMTFDWQEQLFRKPTMFFWCSLLSWRLALFQPVRGFAVIMDQSFYSVQSVILWSCFHVKTCPDAIDEVFNSKLHIIGGVGIGIGVIMVNDYLVLAF